MRPFACALLALAAAPTVAQERLATEWIRRVDTNPNAVYSFAVCPDGSTWAGSGDGTAARVDPAGNVTRHTLPRSGPARLFDCDASGRLWTVHAKAFGALEPGPGGGWSARTVPMRTLTISQAALGPPGVLYAAGYRQGGWQVLHAVDTFTGRIRSTFGPPAPPVLFSRQPGGRLVWDGDAGRLIHVLASEFRVYDPRGALLSVRAVEPPSPVRPAGLGEGMRVEVMGAARLPGGEILVQTRNSGRGRPPFALDLYSPNLDLVETFWGSPAATVAGAAADGSLRFGITGATGVAVMKARLRPIR